ncbi:MAG: Abi-alpha family protein [Candidatus Latescibacter sp.]|nr:Abi-alpha family protein [Candidatus Latescibacter sp.]
MVDDLTGLGKLADSQLVKLAYNDAASGPLKQVGGMTTDALKTFRLFTAPFQLAALAQDRFARWLDQVRSQVPEESQTEASSSIAAPVLRALFFMDDGNPLTVLFLELLKRAIDKERLNEAHPSFVGIIEQLTPDEALILYILRGKTRWLYYNQSNDFDLTEFPANQLAYPEHLEAYILHLKSLNLVSDGEEVIMDDTSTIESSVIKSTAFGDFFTKACIPEGFSIDVYSNK